MKEKVRNNEDPTVFALTTETWRIKKHPTNEEGEVLNPDFNARTYAKKAHKAFLKGQNFFTYKGVTYHVPKMKRSNLDNYLENIELDENDNIVSNSPESEDKSMAEKINKQW